MIYFLSSTHSDCCKAQQPKNSSSLWITAFVLEGLVGMAALLLYLKGVGTIPALLILTGGFIGIEGIAACLSNKSRVKSSLRMTIKDRETQILRFKAIEIPDENALCLPCDLYNRCLPMNESRVHLAGGDPTNGAQIWSGDIQIQGPADTDHVSDLWHLVAEKNIGAIVRIGKDSPTNGGSCIPYTPVKDAPIEYVDLTISATGESRTMNESILCQNYTLSYKDEAIRTIPLYAYENWIDHQTASLREILFLIKELEKIKEPILVHCKGGIGRSGTFNVMRRIYNLYIAAKKEGITTLEIDPVELVRELRTFRINSVENEKQFMMILEFIDLLNSMNINR